MQKFNTSSSFMKEKYQEDLDRLFDEVVAEVGRNYKGNDVMLPFDDAYKEQIADCKKEVFDRDLALRKILQNDTDNINKLSKLSLYSIISIKSIYDNFQNINDFNTKISEVISKQSLMNIKTEERLTKLGLFSSMHGYTLFLLVLSLSLFVYGVDWLALTPFLLLIIANYVFYRRALTKVTENTNKIRESINKQSISNDKAK